jgi:hypothetical protein
MKGNILWLLGVSLSAEWLWVAFVSYHGIDDGINGAPVYARYDCEANRKETLSYKPYAIQSMFSLLEWRNSWLMLVGVEQCGRIKSIQLFNFYPQIKQWHDISFYFNYNMPHQKYLSKICNYAKLNSLVSAPR